MAAEHDVVLRDRERLAGGDQDLLAHDVDAGDRLGDGVLDLDARVHLEEEVLAVRGQQPLDRPGRPVVDGARGVDRERADPRAQLRADCGRGRLLDELLVPPLDRAVALAEMDDVAVRVREDLHLDVARVVEVALDVHRGVGEVRLAFPPRRLEGALDLVRRARDAEPLPASAGGRLDRDRVADLLGGSEDVGGARRGSRRSRHDRHARRAHALARGDLGAHRLDRVRRRPDPDEPCGLDLPRERGVLREEAVARDGSPPRPLAGRRRRSRSPRRYDSLAGPGPSRYASSAIATCSAARSASEYTATAPIPSSRSVRMTRTAISPRLATRILVKGGIGRVFSPTVSLPDQLTVARIAAVPIVVLLFAWDFPNHAYWATAVFVVAMATDQIDGWLARRRGISSALGKLLDPVADKVLVLAALVMLIGEGVAPAWMIALIVVREILVSGLRLAAVERGVVLGARDLGRAKTWAQALAATIAGLAAAGVWSEDVAWWALLAALVATWVSGLDYARVAPRVLRGENA